MESGGIWKRESDDMKVPFVGKVDSAFDAG
jgi:hypothetical protein